MSKGKGIGITVAVIVVAIVVGIASIPDEVLLENPTVDTSMTEDMTIQIPVIEEPEETVPEQTPVEVVEEPEETVPEESDDEGNVIRVGIKDGIGSGDR